MLNPEFEKDWGNLRPLSHVNFNNFFWTNLKTYSFEVHLNIVQDLKLSLNPEFGKDWGNLRSLSHVNFNNFSRISGKTQNFEVHLNVVQDHERK